MPTKRLEDLKDSDSWIPVNRCRDSEHNPPSHMVWPDGVYEHTCPSCGHKTRFTISNPTWG